MGDVILSLPALRAVRDRFPDANVTLLQGKPGADIVRIAGVCDDQIVVDRVELRDGNMFISVGKIFKLVKELRRRRFDFVIDLHSLSETNIFGFLSGAKWRLYANRENRSLDRLANFPVRPPTEDKSKHYTDRYFDVLSALGIPSFDGHFKIAPPSEASAEIDDLFPLGINDKKRIGLFIGAGHPSRCWPLEKFSELAERFIHETDHEVLIFLGPEESGLVDHVRKGFPDSAIVLDKLRLLPLMAAAERLDVLISNDTGPMHLAAVVGAPIVLILDSRAPDIFYPLTQNLRVLKDTVIHDITVEQAFDAAMDLIGLDSSK